jgi:carboxyl-terminal processing protease
LSQYEDEKELEQYLKRQNTVELFAAYGDSHGLKRRNLMIQKSHKMLEKFINSRIIYNIMSEEAWMMYLNQDDPAIKETLRVFRENRAFPAPPAKEEPLKKAAWRWGISNKA